MAAPSADLITTFNNMVADLNQIFGAGAQHPPTEADQQCIQAYWCDTVSILTPKDVPVIGLVALYNDLCGRSNGAKGLNFTPDKDVTGTVHGTTGSVTGTGVFTDCDLDGDVPNITFAFTYALQGGVWIVQQAHASRN